LATPLDQLDEFIGAAARVLEISLDLEWTPAVKSNLEVTLKHAAVVAEFDLPDDVEPAPIFKA
jgi:hypothetical protein